ncbi:MAG: hypothetical protein MZU91_12140 [Desulfosudis oleivorans]|nr:hypothetical protein [Desulfosudis oleivorans]
MHARSRARATPSRRTAAACRASRKPPSRSTSSAGDPAGPSAASTGSPPSGGVRAAIRVRILQEHEGAPMNKPIPPLDLMWLIMETQAEPDARRRAAAVRQAEEQPGGRPRRSSRPARTYQPTPPFNYIPELGGTRLPQFPGGDSLRSRLPRAAHRAARRRDLRRPAAAGGRPARAVARPRPAAVPHLAHRRRAGQPLRPVHQGAPRDHRRRLRHQAPLREPEPESPVARCRRPHSRPTSRCASRARRRRWSIAWPNWESRRPSRRSPSGTSRWARSRRGSPRCWAPTRWAAHRSRRSAGR